MAFGACAPPLKRVWESGACEVDRMGIYSVALIMCSFNSLTKTRQLKSGCRVNNSGKRTVWGCGLQGQRST